MAINLEKYRESILSAWKEVVDDKVATNWLVLNIFLIWVSSIEKVLTSLLIFNSS